MKHIYKILTILSAAMLLAAGCSSKKDLSGTDICGEWKLTVMDGVPAHTLGLEVYVVFGNDGHFETFVPNGGGNLFVKMTGDYLVTGSTASGKYSNGKAWGTDYTVEVSKSELTMRSENGFCTYEKTAVPSEVREAAQEACTSKADGQVIWSL